MISRRDMWLASLGVIAVGATAGADSTPRGYPRSAKATSSDEPGVDLQTQRYEDLTAAEIVSMVVGQPLLETEPDQGERVIQLSLDLEHFISVVPLNPAEVTDEDRREIRKLRDQLTVISGRKVLLHLFGERARRKPVR